MPKYIGLSTRQCFRDMALGLVDPKDVITIISGINVDPQNEDDIQALIDVYEINAWKDLPEATRLFREFLAAGKIEQPKRHDETPPHINLGHWVMNFTYGEEVEKQKEMGIYRASNLLRYRILNHNPD